MPDTQTQNSMANLFDRHPLPPILYLSTLPARHQAQVMPIMKHFDPNCYDLVKLQVLDSCTTDHSDLIFHRSNRDENVNCVK